jgi:hypothetical protein
LLPGSYQAVNDLQIAYGDHNKRAHRFENLQIQLVPMGDEFTALVVTGLKNIQAGEGYLQTLATDQRVGQLRSSVEYKEFIIAQENFLLFYRSKDVEGYEEFYKEMYIDE